MDFDSFIYSFLVVLSLFMVWRAARRPVSVGWAEEVLEALNETARREEQAKKDSKAKADIEYLLEQWRPVDGSPLHWSLNYVLEAIGDNANLEKDA